MNQYKANPNDCIEVLPVNAANASIIWLHGLGASGDDFLPIVEQLKLPKTIRFIFPHAPMRSVTINNGAIMRAWYDIKSFDLTMYHNTNNHEGILESQSIVNNLIEREISYGISPDRIVLGGFSQGGALALHAGLRFNKKLAGIVCLSGYLPWSNILINDRSLANNSTKIFMAHGLLDSIIPIAIAQSSCNLLVSLNYNVLWSTYFMQHNVIDEEIAYLAKYLTGIL